MIPTEEIHEILDGYDNSNLTIATMCSHTGLQMFYGAKKLGFRTLGIYQNENQKRRYQTFRASTPDEFLQVNDYKELGDSENLDKIINDNGILVLHGSFVNLSSDFILNDLKVPIFGNRKAIKWEETRAKQREWLEEKAGIEMPKNYNLDDLEKDKIYFAKLDRARGGKGFFQFKSKPEFKKQAKILKKSGEIGKDDVITIQEYVCGPRYYFHFFYDPLMEGEWKVKYGDKDAGLIELLGIDRRDESNIDGLGRTFLDIEELRRAGIIPSYNVVGNFPLVCRESLLDDIFEKAEKTVEASIELFPPGMIGPFCLETFCTPKLEFKVFEVSARIVAGTNPYIDGSPYAHLTYGEDERMSMGKRIATEIENAKDDKDMFKLITS